MKRRRKRRTMKMKRDLGSAEHFLTLSFFAFADLLKPFFVTKNNLKKITKVSCVCLSADV